jgi:hypothetical protein
MTAPSVKFLPTGLRAAQIFELDPNGRLKATSTSPYYGIVISGPKTFTRNLPAARVITHDGGDGVLDTDMLPPTESPGGELSAGYVDFNLIAAIAGVKVVTIGEMKGIAVATSKEGFEAEVGLVLQQQGKDDSGSRLWRSIDMPKALLRWQGGGMVAEASNQVFQIVPSRVTKHLWRVAFSLATDGCTKAFFRDWVTQYYRMVVAWKGDGVATQFLFDTDLPAVATTKIAGVWVNDVLDASAALALTGVTPTTMPADGDIIVVSYEVANPEEI